VDLAGDLAVDVGIVAHPACQTPASGRVCLGESPGQVGACEGGALTALRHCFAEAPCRDGFCDPQAGGGCISCSGCNAGDELCTLFDTPQKQPETCCVTASPSNGGGDHATSCVTGEVCRSGLCTTEGFCFEACGSFHACALSTCGVVQVVVHEVPVNRTGCRPLQPDGDVAPGDGPRDGTGEAAPGDGSRDGTGEAAPGDGTGDGTGDAVPGDDLAGDLASDAGSAEQQASEAGGNG